MLSSLFVSDLALIRRLSVDFHRGFSVLTGETGAGKSLVLDSLGLFLSSKGGKGLVRCGEEKLEVSLFFTELSREVKEKISDLVSPEEAEEGITLTRIVYAEGRSLCKICGRSIPFSRLSEIARNLIAIHGQNAATGLLDEKNHRLYLDSALDEKGQRALEAYSALYGEYTRIKRELEVLVEETGDAREKVALYDYQMQEIAKVKPKRGEEEALEEKLRSLQSYEKDYSALATAHRALSGGEKGKGAIFLLQAAARKLESFGETEPYSGFVKGLYDMAHQAKEVQEEISSRLSDLGEEDPGDMMDRIQRRMDVLYRLKMKFGKTVDEIIDYYEELKGKKDLTLRGKDDIKKGKENLKRIESALKEAGEKLSEARRRTAEKLEREIHSILSFLDMPKMRFSVLFLPREASAEGMEKVSFGIAANTGEGMMPLSKVASGGEMSRIMLALSLKLGKAKDADTLIFDEIDTGISGATAQKIGISLKTLGESKQIFCVTHSAQVATLSDHHFLVEKKEEEGRTETSLAPLSPEESMRETARLLGGRELSSEALSAAEKLRLEGEREWIRLKDTFI